MNWSSVMGMMLGMMIGWFASMVASEWRRLADHAAIDVLRCGDELYGLEIVRRSGGWLHRGTVYVVLMRLEQTGLITSRKEADGRRVYWLCDGSRSTGKEEANMRSGPT